MKNAIMTITVGKDKSILHMADMAHPYMKHYADKCKADFIIIDDSWRKNEHPCYLKQTVNYFLDNKIYDRILYMDTDMLVKPNTPNLFDMVPKNKLAVFGDKHRKKQIREMREYTKKYNEIMVQNGEKPILFHEWGEIFYNAGLFLCSKETNPHIPPVCNVMRLEGTIYYDQLYFNLMIYKYRIPVFELSYKYNRLHTVDSKVGSRDRYKDSHIIHYAGKRGKSEMEKDYQRLKKEFKI